MEAMIKFGFTGMEPRAAFVMKLATVLDSLVSRIEELETKLADKAEPKKATAKKSAE